MRVAKITKLRSSFKPELMIIRGLYKIRDCSLLASLGKGRVITSERRWNYRSNLISSTTADIHQNICKRKNKA